MIKLEIKTQFKTQIVSAADHAVGLMFTNSMLERTPGVETVGLLRDCWD